MQPLYHELSILSKAVAFKNLSAAAGHVKLSQSQLSRIIARLENELEVVLLDRAVKKGSGWTPVAHKIAEIFERNNRRLENEIVATRKDAMVGELHIGTLEGMADLAMATARTCFEEIGVHQITLDLLDIAELETKFIAGQLDLIFTSKIPGRHKFKYIQEVGYQTFEGVNGDNTFGVYSTFEFNRANRKDLDVFKHVLVSNSLAIKKEWFKTVGGRGKVPSIPMPTQIPDSEPVLLIGAEVLSPALWENVVKAASLKEH